MAVRFAWTKLFGALLVALLGCGDDRLVESPCREDSSCEGGYLCEEYRCVPAETKSCDVVIDGNPILQPTPYTASFGAIDTPEAVQKIELHNIGNCTLTIFEANLKAGDGSAFGCEFCKGQFPIEIFPGRKKEIEIAFAAPGVGSYSDELKILSDDREFPELRVPLHSTFLGVPELRVAPSPIDFGYVAQGRVLKKRIQITNQGTGIAELEIQSVSLSPSETQDFSSALMMDGPVRLKPAAEDKNAIIGFDLSYHPRSSGAHQVELVVTTSKGELRVPVKGNSETPPRLTFNPTQIDLGQVPLGTTHFQALTLVNEGGAPLAVQYAWGGPNPSTDLFATPTVLPEIAPGAYVEMQVAVTVTSVGTYNGLLILTTNDPSRPSVTIPVTGEGVPGPGPEVVKIEMTYDNGSDNVFDKDLRNVDMTLEHPYGYVCNKQEPAPTNWGNYGQATWIAFAPKEEPERIVLANATQDGTYRVMLTYMEDCKSLPTDLLAGVLGISVDALIGYLSGGVININGQDVGKLISQLCLDKDNSNATVRVYVNGTIIQEKTVSLGTKGDSLYALDLIRQGGKFTAP